MDYALKYKNTPIKYKTSGIGRAVVLLHGFLEDLTMWDTVYLELSQKNRVIAIDLLGHGFSGNLGYIHTMEEQAKMIKVVLNHLRLRKYILIGHSMGGYVSLAFAELFPNSIKGLCLLNSTAAADTTEKKLNRDRAIVVVKENHKMFIKMSIPNLFTEDNRIIFKQEIENTINDALKLSIQGIIASLEGMKIRKNRLDLLKSGNFKKIMIFGAKDPVLDANTLKREAKNTNTNWIEFPDGHMSHIENKTELLKILKEFIKTCN